ncbi:hypothetical protein D1007_02514 [Hordeum vulgare]|nr:hypothetical protein D1007_02514 [Hordeum vulgare]
MEETNKAFADLTAAISAMSTQIGEIHSIILKLEGRRPAIKRLVDELRKEVTKWRENIHATCTALASGPDPGLTKEKETAPLIRLTDLPLVLPLAADTSLHRQAFLLRGSGLP